MVIAFDEKDKEYKQASCLVMSLEKQVEEQSDEIEQLKTQLESAHESIAQKDEQLAELEVLKVQMEEKDMQLHVLREKLINEEEEKKKEERSVQAIVMLTDKGTITEEMGLTSNMPPMAHSTSQKYSAQSQRRLAPASSMANTMTTSLGGVPGSQTNLLTQDRRYVHATSSAAMTQLSE